MTIMPTRPSRWTARLLLVLLGLASAAVVTLPAADAAGLADEAQRQLDFAEAELNGGNFDRALKSAESALRLDPTLYQAFVLKALAYEGLGNTALAESLLVAYQELTKAVEGDPRVGPTLERLRTPQPRRRGPAQATRTGAAQASPEVDGDPTALEPIAGAEAVASLDPAPYLARVQDALDAGQCASARAAASEFALAQPGLPDGYRFLGDAARCDGRSREAVLAYRRYKDLGGTDAAVDLMIRGLSANLATVVAVVDLPSDGVLAHAVLSTPTESLTAPQGSGGSFEFGDLPTGQDLVISITGKGLRPTDLEVAPLAAGERREIPVAVEYIGLVRVQVLDHDPSLCATTLLTPDGDVVAAPDSESEVTASDVVALVSGQYGEIEVPLDVASGGLVQFDPTPWVPTGITIINVPNGSSLRVFVEGFGGAVVEKEIQVPVGLGTLDPVTGVMIADPQRVDSLIGGMGGVFVEHPVLGAGNVAVVLAPGSANATTFEWKELAGVSRIEAAYQDWSSGREVLRKRSATTTGIFVGIAVGGGVASGILWAVAAAAGGEADGSKSLALTAGDATEVDLSQISGHREAYEAAASRRTAAIVGGSITAALAGTGLVVSITFGAKGQRDVAAHGDWDASAVTAQ